MSIVLWGLAVSILFVLSAGFQLFIFTALYDQGGSIWLTDRNEHTRIIEFVMASAIFTFSLISFYKFFTYMWKGLEKR